MINYKKLLDKFKENNISTYDIRKKNLIPQGIYTKMKLYSGNSFEEIETKVNKYKNDHGRKILAGDVSTKTIEEICQLFQCQPQNIIEWKVNLIPKESYESKYGGK